MALETELKHYESIKEELLKHHEGKYALIIGEKLIGTFDHREEAYNKGIQQRGNVPMLIKRISAEDDPPSTNLALHLGLLHARL